MHIIPATNEAFAEMKGQKFVPHNNEGVIYIKLVALKPETVELGDPGETVNNARGVIVSGDLDAIKAQFLKWFDELVEEYKS